jgi:cytochrome c oxidase subunit II
MVLARLGAFWATLAAVALAPAAAFADKPKEWEWDFQEPATPVMEAVVQLHDKLLWIIIIISIFVLGLLVYVMVRFNEKRNPKPSRTTHNTTIEVLWTVIPVLILLFIAFGPPMSSFRLLYLADRAPDAAMTIKAIGHQWSWSYEYPDNGNITIDANLNTDAPAELRLLDTDNHIFVPVNTKVRLLTTGDAVLRGQARRRPRPHQRDLVRGAARGHILRPMLGAVRQRPRLHADRRRGGQQGQVRRLGPEEQGGAERRRARHDGCRRRKLELTIREGSKR